MVIEGMNWPDLVTSIDNNDTIRAIKAIVSDIYCNSSLFGSSQLPYMMFQYYHTHLRMRTHLEDMHTARLGNG